MIAMPQLACSFRFERESNHVFDRSQLGHREPAQSVCVADCYFIVNVLDLRFASPIAIYR